MDAELGIGVMGGRGGARLVAELAVLAALRTVAMREELDKGQLGLCPVRLRRARARGVLVRRQLHD